MQEEAELVGARLGAGRAISGEVRLPRLDVVLRRAAPAENVLVERLGLAACQAGDDEPGVGSLISDLNARDDPLDPAPARGSIVKLFEAPHLAVLRSRGVARHRAGLQGLNMP